jgi:hypothetical protein
VNEEQETAMEVARPTNGIARQGFGSTEIEHRRETQGTALAAKAQADVQARYIVAERSPRDIEQFRLDLLKQCKRPGFAVIAEYAKPVGGTSIKGPSIRFVETALRAYRNTIQEESIIYDDETKRTIRVTVTDLETNETYSSDVPVNKTVERKNPKSGDDVMSTRQNSRGETVFVIRATEDDFANKAASACSKKLRNLGLRILPADIVDEAMVVCRKTRQDKDAQDPAAARRQIVDAFAELHVMPAMLDDYLGHPFEQASPAELDELRAAYMTVKDGEARWIDLVEVKKVARGEAEKPTKTTEAAGHKLSERIALVRSKKQATDKPVVDVKEETK